MSVGALLVYAYLVGTAFSACAGSLVEWRSTQTVRLRAPFVTQRHILRSLAFVLMAGPYLMRAELRLAHAQLAISSGAAFGGLLFATGWALASGIIWVELIAWCSNILPLAG